MLTLESLVGTGNIDKAAIFSAAGDSKWASSTGFEAGADELKAIVAAFKDTSDPKNIQSTGFHVAGEKYITIKADERSLYGMKVGKTGVIVVKTAQSILVCHYPETVQAPQAATTVEQLADYLLGVGY
ncbi:MAG: profilin, required for normal timing of actin polymerization in response to thermal stress [Stictis urceolatum]|nr:profilin, required for normal timing of actin polymerization in response to thermal stress [Stictis urceolata]